MARETSHSATSRPKKLAAVKAKLMSSTCVASLRYGNRREIAVVIYVNRSAVKNTLVQFLIRRLLLDSLEQLQQRKKKIQN